MKVKKRLTKYIATNVLAMIGMSLYILADSIFISMANGSDGLTSLNLTLPLYSLVYAIGAMVGIGSSIKFALYINTNKDKAKDYFSNAVIWNFLLGTIFTVIFWFYSKGILVFLGADNIICDIASSYIKWAMIFAPFFMMNFTFVGFVRNDNDPSLAMVATIVSSLSNAVLDYVFMFSMDLGMIGAALATGVSPIISILICMLHFLKRNNRICFKMIMPDIKKLVEVSKTGVSAFIGEISGGVTTLTFNYMLLGIGGNVCVAAYGVISNIAIVVTAIFNGVAQGLQPLVSEYCGIGKDNLSNEVLKLSKKITIVISIIIIVSLYMNSDVIIDMFNSQNSKELATMASNGIRLYFIAYIFAGLNIIKTSYCSANNNIKEAFVISILRGTILITIYVLILGKIFGINGVWLSFLSTEITTFIISKYIEKNH